MLIFQNHKQLSIHFSILLLIIFHLLLNKTFILFLTLLQLSYHKEMQNNYHLKILHLLNALVYIHEYVLIS